MPEQIQQLVDRFGGMRRVLTLGVGLGAVALIFAVSRWASAPVWTPVFNNLPIESVGQLTDRLDQAGIKYKLENGGAQLLVAAQDVARARVAVARDGGMPNAGRSGMELFDQPSWSMTDFTQRINYRRALEGELERTIGKMRGIEGAQVHLALHETSTFRNADTPAEASVVLKTRADGPSPDVVRGIAHLVASSVDGLRSENVTVVDDAGRLLTDGNEGGGVALTNQQLTLQREMESHLENKAEKLVSQMVGKGNARVQVAAAMNFDRIERTTQTVDPEKQAMITDQKAEITPGAAGGAGSTNQATSYENSKSTETFAQAAGTVKRLTVAVLLNERQMGTPDKPKFEARSPEEIARIQSLVQSAVGIDSARGDVVSVVSMPFNDAAPMPKIETPKQSIVSVIKEYQQPAVGTLGLVLAFVVALLALKSLRTPTAAETPRLAAATAGAMPQLKAETINPASLDIAVSDFVPVNSPTRNRALSAVEMRPDDAARLVRSWIKDV